MRRKASQRTRKYVSAREECPAANQLYGPGARIRGFFQQLADRMRASIRRRRRRRKLALSIMQSEFVPPFGRVRTWKVCRKFGPGDTYVVVQVPKHVSSLTSCRIKEAVRKGVEQGISSAPECGKNKLFLILTDLVKLLKR